MKKYLKLLLLFFLALVIIGCNKEENDNSYTIKFSTDCELTYEDVVIEKQQTIDLPTPTKKGFKFIGWYPSEKFVKGTEVTKDTVIGKNITLYAKWESIKVNVVLNTNGGQVAENVKTEYNIYSVDTIDLPKVSKDQYIFLGWFVGNTKYEGKVSFLEDTIVEARFIALSELQSEYNVTLNLNGGKFYDFDEPLSDEVLNSREYQYLRDENLSDALNKILYEFTVDFCSFKNRPSYFYEWVRYNIFDNTYESLIGNSGFLSYEYYLGKWEWLFQTLEYYAEPQNKQYFADIYSCNYTQDNKNYFEASACIRAELAGLFDVDQYVYGDYLYYSHKYTEEEILNIENLFNLTKYEPGKETIVFAPIKDGYVFRGWYDNPEFTGDAIWSIPDTWFGDITLYARWEEI